MNPSGYPSANWVPGATDVVGNFDLPHMASGLNPHTHQMFGVNMGQPHALGVMNANQPRASGGMPLNPQHVVSGMNPASGLVPNQHPCAGGMASSQHGMIHQHHSHVSGVMMSNQPHVPGLMMPNYPGTNILPNQTHPAGGMNHSSPFATGGICQNSSGGQLFTPPVVSSSITPPFYPSSIVTTSLMTVSAPAPAFQNMTTQASPIITTSNWASRMTTNTVPTTSQHRLASHPASFNSASLDSTQSNHRRSSADRYLPYIPAPAPQPTGAPNEQIPGGNRQTPGYHPAQSMQPTNNPIQSPQRDSKPVLPPPPLSSSSQRLQHAETAMHEPNLTLLSQMRPEIRSQHPNPHINMSGAADTFSSSRVNHSASQPMAGTMANGMQWYGTWSNQGMAPRSGGTTIHNSGPLGNKRSNDNLSPHQAKRPATGDCQIGNSHASTSSKASSNSGYLPQPGNATSQKTNQRAAMDLSPLFDILMMNIQPNQLERPLLHNTILRWLCNKCGPVMDMSHKRNTGHLVLPCRMLPENVLPYRCETCPGGSFRIFEQFIHHLRQHQGHIAGSRVVSSHERMPSQPSQHQHLASSQMLQQMAQINQPMPNPVISKNGVATSPKQQNRMQCDQQQWTSAMNGSGMMPGNTPHHRMSMEQLGASSFVSPNHTTQKTVAKNQSSTSPRRSTDKSQHRYHNSKSTHSSGSNVRLAPTLLQPSAIPQNATLTHSGHSNRQEYRGMTMGQQPLIPNTRPSSDVVDYSNILNIVPLGDAADVPDAFANRSHASNLVDRQVIQRSNIDKANETPRVTLVKPEMQSNPRQRFNLHVDLTDTETHPSTPIAATGTPDNNHGENTSDASLVSRSVSEESKDATPPPMIKPERHANPRRRASFHMDLTDQNKQREPSTCEPHAADQTVVSESIPPLVDVVTQDVTGPSKTLDASIPIRTDFNLFDDAGNDHILSTSIASLTNAQESQVSEAPISVVPANQQEILRTDSTNAVNGAPSNGGTQDQNEDQIGIPIGDKPHEETSVDSHVAAETSGSSGRSADNIHVSMHTKSSSPHGKSTVNVVHNQRECVSAGTINYTAHDTSVEADSLEQLLKDGSVTDPPITHHHEPQNEREPEPVTQNDDELNAEKEMEPESPCPLALVMNFADSLPTSEANTPAPTTVPLDHRAAADLSKNDKAGTVSEQFDTERLLLNVPNHTNAEFADLEFSSQISKKSVSCHNEMDVAHNETDISTDVRDALRSMEAFVAKGTPSSELASKHYLGTKNDSEDILTQFLNEDSSSFDQSARNTRTTENTPTVSKAGNVADAANRIADPAFFNLVDLYSESDSSSAASTNSCPSTIAYGLSSPESTHANERTQPLLTGPPGIHFPENEVVSDVDDEVVRPSSGHSGHRTPDSGHVTSDSVSEHSVSETPEHFKCTCAQKQQRRRPVSQIIEISDDEEAISMEPDVIPWDT